MNMDYEHQTVNHKLQFVYEGDAYTQNIKHAWRDAKSFNPAFQQQGVFVLKVANKVPTCQNILQGRTLNSVHGAAARLYKHYYVKHLGRIEVGTAPPVRGVEGGEIPVRGYTVRQISVD